MNRKKPRIAKLAAAGLAIGLVLASAMAPAAEDIDESICRQAFNNCLGDLVKGLLGWWDALTGLAYCLNGREFCLKYVVYFL